MVLRELLVKLGLDVDSQSFAKGQLLADGVKLALGKLVDVARAFEENIKSVIDYGDHVNKASQKIGVGIEALQELQYAAELSDISADAMAQSLGFLSRNIQSAKEGSKEAATALKGIDFQQGGKLKSADEVLAQVADRFKSMPDGVEKTALSMQLFGRAGREMIPFLNQGASGIGALRQEARDLGLVIDEDAARASEELNDNLTRLKAVSTGLWRQAITPLLPVMNQLVSRFLAWKRENAAIISSKIRQWIGYLITGFKALGESIRVVWNVGSEFVGMIVDVGRAVVSLIEKIPGLKAAFLTVAAIVAIVNAPLIAVVAALGALFLLVDDYLTFKKNPKAKTIFGIWSKALDEWLKPAKDEPWFLRVIKEFVRTIRDALKLIDEFRNKTAPAVSNPSKVNAASPEWKKARVAAGPMTAAETAKAAAMSERYKPRELAWWERFGDDAYSSRYRDARTAGASWWQATKAGLGFDYMPSMPAPAVRAPAGGVMVSAPVNMSVTTQPGQSNEEISRQVGEQIQSYWNGKMEEAHAGVGQ